VDEQRSSCVCGCLVRTEDVGGELAEADVPAAAGLAVVEHPGDEEVGVEGDGEDGGERGEAEAPPHAAERVRQREHRRPHDGRRLVEPRVPPRPCTGGVRQPCRRGRDGVRGDGWSYRGGYAIECVYLSTRARRRRRRRRGAAPCRPGGARRRPRPRRRTPRRTAWRRAPSRARAGTACLRCLPLPWRARACRRSPSLLRVAAPARSTHSQSHGPGSRRSLHRRPKTTHGPAPDR
jgi:hypothetical protein